MHSQACVDATCEIWRTKVMGRAISYDILTCFDSTLTRDRINVNKKVFYSWYWSEHQTNQVQSTTAPILIF